MTRSVATVTATPTGRLFDNADWPFAHGDTSGAGSLVLYLWPVAGTFKCYMVLT